MQEQQVIEHPHHVDFDELIKELNSNEESGLSSSEAKERLKKYGPNRLAKHKEKSIWQIILDQINSPVVYLLVAAAALSFIMQDIPEGIAIVVVLLINAVIGFIMEYQARQSMKALQQMDKITAKAVRDGETKEIDAEELVPGDLIEFESGDLIPADVRIIQASELEINESPLTGESVPVEKGTDPVEKDTQVADRKNMAFKGTAITRGKGKAIVTATGMDTEIGNVSEMVSSAGDEEVPLNQKLNNLTKKLIWLVLGLAAALGVVGLITDKEIMQIVQTSIAWAIAAIPEGLPIVASIALSRGMLRLGRQNVIVKQLAAVETLGETNLIFTDKTGTLTQNQLTVSKLVFANEKESTVNWDDKNVEVTELDRSKEHFEKVFEISVLCNDSEFDRENEENNEGDPLEIGLHRFAEYQDSDRRKEVLEYEFIAEDPFDHESKMMGTIHKNGDGYFLAAKGAATSIIDRSTKFLDENGEEKELKKEDKEKWLKKNDELANDGLRTLAFGYKNSGDKPKGTEEQEFIDDLVFTGLIGFIDPPAKEVGEAVKTCKEAGIDVVMVTGDHPGTALNIAKKVNVVDEDHEDVIHGDKLEEEMDQKDFINTRIFSRVDPAQKLKIVEKYQENNKIVGMTGDGVNDAPALKTADIGIAMGQRGTQVAKEVADMILKDDSFPAIVNAVKEGRIIFGNIRKFIVYQLSYHFSEILVISAIMFITFKLALLPLQLLFLNLLTDVFPALALGIGEGRKEVMKRKPKDPEEPILSKRSWLNIGVYGVILATSVIGAYFFAKNSWGLSDGLSNNVAFFTLAIAQLLHVFDMRDHDENVFNNQVTRNKFVWMAIAFCGLALGSIYFIPGLHGILSLEQMEARVWLLIGIASFAPILVIQILKIILGKKLAH